MSPKTSKACRNLGGYRRLIDARVHWRCWPCERRERDWIARQHGAVIGVGHEDISPFFSEVLQLALEPLRLTVARVRAAARGFQMQHLCVRGEYDALAVRAQLEAIVDIVEINREPKFIHSADIE